MGGSGSGGATGAGGQPMGTMPTALGQLVITEIMADSAVAMDDVGEWIEIYNPSAVDTFDLLGCTIADTAHIDAIARDVMVPPMAVITLARSVDPSLGFVPTYNYSTVKFADEGDQVLLRCNNILIDSVDFRTWTITKGHSLSLGAQHSDATANDLQTSWCPSMLIYNRSSSTFDLDFGTPGVLNPPCP
jgi:hypothetical protein